MSNLLNFGKNKSPSDVSPETERTEKAFFTVDILTIETSQLNPRHSKGEHYDSLKASIKATGLQNPLTITKYPDSPTYTLFNGGNTRLTILKELYEEYMQLGEADKANSIKLQQCIFHPYTDDLDILIKHMAENEERSNMTFIDKARAVFHIKELYLKQEGLEEVSNRALCEFIHSLGWTRINQPSMTELHFAYFKLDIGIPKALANGMGKPKINQIRVWLGYVKKYVDWLVSHRQIDYSVDAAESLYFRTLASFDDEFEPIDLQSFFEDYLLALSDALLIFDSQLDVSTIRFELKQIEELGYVPEVQDQKQLSNKLEETAPVPVQKFPEPRKPRSQSTATKTANTGNQAVTVNPKTITGEAPQADEELKLFKASDIVDEEAINLNAKNKWIAIFNDWLNSYDEKGTLQQFFEVEDSDDFMQAYPPYFNLNLTNDSDQLAIQDRIMSSSHQERFLILHLLGILNTYYSSSFIQTSDQLTDTHKHKHKHIQNLWQDHARKYGDYFLAVSTNIISETVSKEANSTLHKLKNQFLEQFDDITKIEQLFSEAEGDSE